jgi:D-aminoacyl-tRNA deacylase
VKVLIQRVSRASVTVDGEVVGQIGQGLLAFVGVGHGDGLPEVEWMAEKMSMLRVFEDEEGKMNRSLVDVGGEALIVSQFTLLADCRKGRRPAFTDAALPARANEIYEAFIARLRQQGVRVATGRFAASMQVELVNEGPVTIMLERTASGNESSAPG